MVLSVSIGTLNKSPNKELPERPEWSNIPGAGSAFSDPFLRLPSHVGSTGRQFHFLNQGYERLPELPPTCLNDSRTRVLQRARVRAFQEREAEQNWKEFETKKSDKRKVSRHNALVGQHYERQCRGYSATMRRNTLELSKLKLKRKRLEAPSVEARREEEATEALRAAAEARAVRASSEFHVRLASKFKDVEEAEAKDKATIRSWHEERRSYRQDLASRFHQRSQALKSMALLPPLETHGALTHRSPQHASASSMEAAHPGTNIQPHTARV